MKLLPEAMPLNVPAGTSVEMTSSEFDVIVTAAPEGVALALWLLRTELWSRGATVSMPENSQITAPPLVLPGFGVIDMELAPALLFFAYQMSTMSFVDKVAMAGPASTYVLPALSVIPLIVGAVPHDDDQATTIRLPDPVGVIGHDAAGNVWAPHEVTRTKVICAEAISGVTDRTANNIADLGIAIENSFWNDFANVLTPI